MPLFACTHVPPLLVERNTPLSAVAANNDIPFPASACTFESVNPLFTCDHELPLFVEWNTPPLCVHTNNSVSIIAMVCNASESINPLFAETHNSPLFVERYMPFPPVQMKSVPRRTTIADTPHEEPFTAVSGNPLLTGIQ